MILLLMLLFMFLLAAVAVVVSFQHHLLPSAHRAKREPAFIHIIMLPQLVVNQSKHIYANPFPLETRGKWCIINSYTHTHMYAIDNEKQRGAWDKRKTYVAIMSVCVCGSIYDDPQLSKHVFSRMKSVEKLRGEKERWGRVNLQWQCFH